MSPTTNRAREFSWSCTLCKKKGTVDVFPYAHEKNNVFVIGDRHSLTTRAACVTGCMYLAVPMTKPRKSAAVDPSEDSNTGTPPTRDNS